MGILDSCPFALLKQPAVAEIANLYWLRTDGCLNPADTPVPVMEAIHAYARGISRRWHDNIKNKD